MTAIKVFGSVLVTAMMLPGSVLLSQWIWSDESPPSQPWKQTVFSLADIRSRDDCYELVYMTHDAKCRAFTKTREAEEECLGQVREVLEHCFDVAEMKGLPPL